MADPLIIEVDKAQADAWFGELLRRGQSLGGLMADIGEALTKSSQERFADGVGPDGIAWEALADGSGRTPLNDTHRMRDGIFPSSGDDWAEISADAKQARWHQEGTDPYVIEPKNGKALAFGPPASRISGKNKGEVGPAHVVQKVNHPGLPARPFIGLSKEDGEQIDALAIAWLDLSSEG